MQFPSWRSAAQFEQSTAVVLVAIGLGGFIVDVALKPISPAGLALLLLAATPSLVSILRRKPSATGVGDAQGSAEKPSQSAVLPPRTALARAGAQESPRAGKTAAQGVARDQQKQPPATAGRARDGGEGRQATGMGNPAPRREPDRPKVPLPVRDQRQPEAGLARPGIEAPVVGSRGQPGLPLSHPNAL